ncbi:MAG TPA: metal ABC transporter ATP-binding protein [Candidatus Limnocylindrales bacterium]|nr:metal ABC transporter ATP-binding protein [Candidatus Limnocylindrales bacterium]
MTAATPLPSSGMPAVRLRGVSAGYGDVVALREVDLEIERGSLLAVFGPNGGGKTTLLKLVAGLLQPWSGTIEVLGSRPGVEARRIAYVPQAELVDWSFPVSVWNVAMMGRYPRLGPLRQPGAADRAAVAEALRRVGMLDRSRSQIGGLSGGQRRRAFLARAIAAEAELYLLDEPVTGVDAPTQEDLMALLADEAAAGKTVIATTHDLAAASRHFHQVVGINRGVTASGPASILGDPEILARTYGGHLLVIGERGVLLDDAHHHDAASGSERHFHDTGSTS